MSEKGSTRTNRVSKRLEHTSQEQIDIGRRRAMKAAGVLLLGGIGVAAWKNMKPESDSVVRASAEYGADTDATPAESVAETDLKSDNTPELVSTAVEPLALNSSAEAVAQAYVQALNSLIAPDQSINVTNELFAAYYDAYLLDGWQDDQASLLSSDDGTDLVRQVADKVEAGQSATGQLKLYDLHASQDGVIFPIVEVKGYTPDQDEPQYGYESIIPTKYARLQLTMAQDNERQRLYFADATIVGFFNQPDVVE